MKNDQRAGAIARREQKNYTSVAFIKKAGGPSVFTQ